MDIANDIKAAFENYKARQEKAALATLDGIPDLPEDEDYSPVVVEGWNGMKLMIEKHEAQVTLLSGFILGISEAVQRLQKIIRLLLITVTLSVLFAGTCLYLTFQPKKLESKVFYLTPSKQAELDKLCAEGWKVRETKGVQRGENSYLYIVLERDS